MSPTMKRQANPAPMSVRLMAPDPRGSRWSRVFALLVGPGETFPLRHRLLNAVLIATTLIGLLSGLLNATVLSKPGVPAPLFLFGVVNGVCYVLSRRQRGLYFIVPTVNVTPLLLGAWAWFPMGGRSGPAPIFLFIAALIPITVSKGAHRIVGFVLYLAATTTLFVLEYLHPEWVGHVYTTRGNEFLDATISYFLSCFAVGAFMFTMARGYDTVVAALADEQAKSQRLLDNVLPPTVSARLRDNDGSVADSFENVTVLFADIVGFTRLTAPMAPHEVVVLLNEVFSRFDALSVRYGLEKVKTIGDAYMAVAGIPFPLEGHAGAAAAMALDMLKHAPAHLQLRVGLHSGPAVAGVIGTHKFIYDLWGDTVNTASRMESQGEPGLVQISKATADLLSRDPRFRVRSRGIVAVKGKGEMETFFLDSSK